MPDICGTCKRPENFPDEPESELRPYGPGGEMICFTCAFKDEESTERTEHAFGALLEGSFAISNVVTFGTKAGPQPYIEEQDND